MKIYDKNDIELLDVNVSDDSYRQREIMASPSLTLYFELNSFVDLPVGAYADFEGERFYLFDKANFTKDSGKQYSYTLIMHGIAEKLNRFRFYDYANGGLIFSLTANPLTHIEMLVNVLNAKDSGWTVGTVSDQSEIVVSYSHNSCLEALNMVCDEAELEYEITSGKVINLRKTEYNKEDPLALAYGQGNGLKPGIERKNDDNERPVERLYVQGGERNIDYSTYGSRYLLLPKSQELTYNGRTYATDANGLYIERTDKAIDTGQEGSLDASSIYPSRVGIVTAVEVEDADQNLYNIIDSTIPEALNFEDYLIAGETMTIVFQSGMLTGKEFEVTYDHEFRRFELVPKDIDGYTMPSATFTPAVDDTFAVFGCAFPDAYVSDDDTQTGASWDMFREAVAYLYEHEEEKYSYSGSVSSIWLQDNWATAAAKLILGGYCSLTDPELGGVLIRIRSIKDLVNDPYDVTIDLSNALVEPSITTQLARLNSYTASLTVQQLVEAREAALAAGLDVTEITNIMNSYYPSFSDITGTPMDNEALAEYLKQITDSAITDTESKIISGSILYDQGLTYDATAFDYKILGNRYDSVGRELTLDDADPTYPRIDIFYLDMFSNINVRTGVPAAAPVAPTVSSLELYVTQAYIPAGALEPSNINVERVYDELDVDEWTPTTFEETGNTAVDDAATADAYNGTKHIQVDIAVPDEVLSTPDHYIGEEYQGGIIFWLDPLSDGKKGLIAAKQDTVTDVFWSRLSGYSTYTTGATGVAIGTGQSNSALMLALPASAGQAIKYVDELVIDGYGDWFMGSEDEMKQLWARRYDVGGFNPTKAYWTSTEKSWQDARRVDWKNGALASRDKNNRYNVRAIRAFDDTTLPSTDPVEYFTPTDTSIVFEAGDDLPTSLGILSFKMKTSAEWRANSILLFELYKGAVRTGSCALSPATSMFGFNDSNNEDYQLVALDLFNFAPTQDVFNAIKVSLVSSWPNNLSLLLDDIRFQYSDVDAEIFAQGTFGSEVETLRVTINSQGKATDVQVLQNTPYDGTVSYAKAASTLTSRVTNNTGAWDLSAQGIVEATISTAVTVALSNLQENKAITVLLTIASGGSLTMPSYCKLIDGSVDLSNSPDAGTYIIDFHCLIATEGSEFVRTSIGEVL